MAGSATGTGNIREFNGHYYQVVDDQAIDHSLAFDNAANMSYDGITGHLVTITSASENQFITDYLELVVGTHGLY